MFRLVCTIQYIYELTNAMQEHYYHPFYLWEQAVGKRKLKAIIVKPFRVFWHASVLRQKGHSILSKYCVLGITGTNVYSCVMVCHQWPLFGPSRFNRIAPYVYVFMLILCYVRLYSKKYWKVCNKCSWIQSCWYMLEYAFKHD